MASYGGETPVNTATLSGSSSATYTVPAGRYAKVSGFASYNGGSVTIGGEALPSGGSFISISNVVLETGASIVISSLTNGEVYFGIVEFNNP